MPQPWNLLSLVSGALSKDLDRKWLVRPWTNDCSSCYWGLWASFLTQPTPSDTKTRHCEWREGSVHLCLALAISSVQAISHSKAWSFGTETTSNSGRKRCSCECQCTQVQCICWGQSGLTPQTARTRQGWTIVPTVLIRPCLEIPAPTSPWQETKPKTYWGCKIELLWLYWKSDRSCEPWKHQMFQGYYESISQWETDVCGVHSKQLACQVGWVWGE